MSPLPPLRALQTFECFGRLGSVQATAVALRVTAGAVSQQLKLLEAHLGVPLLIKEGRRTVLTPAGQGYHTLLAQGFGRLLAAQDYITSFRLAEELAISALPTLLQRWLNPHLAAFHSAHDGATLRLLAQELEPDGMQAEQGFRLTYGEDSRRHTHSRILFRDRCFPAAAPDFLARHPAAVTPEGLTSVPLLAIDWGPHYSNEPDWRDWLSCHGAPATVSPRPVAVYSSSSMALDAAIAGMGVVLAQEAFAAADLAAGRLVRLSPAALPMASPYYICWGHGTLSRPLARQFLDWIMLLSRPLRRPMV